MTESKSKSQRDQFITKINEPSILGSEWYCMYETDTKVNFLREHFETAMMNVIREPNINSTAVLRADILKEIKYENSKTDDKIDHNEEITIDNTNNEDFNISVADSKQTNILDMELRIPQLSEELDFHTFLGIVRRMVPRNPYKDALINQTCLMMESPVRYPESSLVIYTPHLDKKDDCPFYIPAVKNVAILFHEEHLSVHYLFFSDEQMKQLIQDESERIVRTAWRLLQTAYKHSRGVMQGYEKRVNHDQVVDKVKFQNQYITIKKKYSQFLVENWKESTDPKKHVFEDIAIAAFLLELWNKIYGPDFKNKMQFRDLGCGNGVLCYILIEEGCKGIGIDARHRKSWAMYPTTVRKCLKEQVIVPSVLLRPHPDLKKNNPYLTHNNNLFPVKMTSQDLIAPATVLFTSEDLLNSPQVNATEFPTDTFVIGNHSDELTCWIPLLGYNFMIIPCCSHNFSGQKIRFNVRKQPKPDKQASSDKNASSSKISNSTYAGLVDHVCYISEKVGWKIEKEMLRIPSTRNAAIIGYKNDKLSEFPTQEVYDMLQEDGGPSGWIHNTMQLMKKNPRNH
ncbi:hypothetical protein TPHA_0C01790 [Tetrapisispora phaffii CBS 4417]|uniref:tRNA (uracil-O(2)-)-methyltransferase n=1 Tax=Tetrapisispora phaffii (strain ATCC 24235 / CBS 4417 / NBRC 1672 / NRRL Y-8282 / UCD 70-5) TaxID=1071381 RepID=G8BRF9_TETPH|nr:hypothetical protein TPHA_0C01790 [Tetrapisispora phaffii CBS 4417]CCE62335.1 hypothetical protein TPHA_0C01790 [Tetrapisispora phaffii CBS 4417]